VIRDLLDIKITVSLLRDNNDGKSVVISGEVLMILLADEERGRSARWDTIASRYVASIEIV